MDQKKKKDKTEGATGLGRTTTELIETWNQMTALRFHTGEGGDIIRSARPPFGPIWERFRGNSESEVD